MSSWVVIFLITALIAGVLRFGSIAGASIEIAKAIAVILFLVSALVAVARGRNRV